MVKSQTTRQAKNTRLDLDAIDIGSNEPVKLMQPEVTCGNLTRPSAIPVADTSLQGVEIPLQGAETSKLVAKAPFSKTKAPSSLKSIVQSLEDVNSASEDYDLEDPLLNPKF